MAVKITNQDCNLNTANAFDEVVAYNLSGFSNTASLAGTYATLTTERFIPFTPSKGGNFKGCVLTIFESATTDDRTILVKLQKNIAGNWIDMTSQRLVWTDIHNITRTDVTDFKIVRGMYTIYFNNFDAVIVIDTSADTWRLSVSVEGSTGNKQLIYGYNATTFMYAISIDSPVSYVDTTDTPIFAHYCTINTNFSPIAVLGTGDTTYGISGVICSNMNYTDYESIPFLKCINPASAITINLNGSIIANGHAGINFQGTKTNKITINAGTPAVGTVAPGIKCYYNNASTSYDYSNRQIIILKGYGEGDYVDNQTSILDEDSLMGTGTITLDEDLSSVWSIGDTIAIGKQDVTGQGSFTRYTIKAFGYEDTQVLLTANDVPSPYVASASTLVAGYEAYRAFDNSLTTYWRVTSTTTSWVKLDFGSAKTIKAYTLYVLSTQSTRAPKNWTIQGSNNDIDYDVIDTQTNITTWTTTNFFVISTPGSYRYYRINITNNNEGTTYTYIYGLRYLEENSNSIVLNSTIEDYNRLEGGIVQNMTTIRYPININGNATYTMINQYGASSQLLINNCIFYKTSFTNRGGYYYLRDNSTCEFISEVKNCCIYTDEIVNSHLFLNTYYVTVKGLNLEDISCYRVVTCTTIYQYNNTNIKAGTITAKDIYHICKYTSAFLASAAQKIEAENLYFQNCSTGILMYILGRNSTYKNLRFWGVAEASGNHALYVTSLSSHLENIYINKCSQGITFNGTSSKCIFKNVYLGTESSNSLNDIHFIVPAYVDVVFENTYYTTLSSTIEDCDGISFLKFTDYNGITNNDKVVVPTGIFQRCGSLLDDTTVLGTNLYSLRFYPNISGIILEWSQNIPIGNIQNKTMVVMCKVKINSANYYVGTDYQLPRLTVNYDNGSEAYAVASNSTDEQTLVVPFILLTTYGQITVTVNGYTDATSSDAYFYIGDAQVLYPAGHQVNTGDFSLWAEAFPVVPWIATNIQAADVWAYLTASATVSGSIGKFITELNNISTGDIRTELAIELSYMDAAISTRATDDSIRLELATELAHIDADISSVATDSSVRLELTPELTMVDELHKIQGLDISNPMTVTPTLRTAGDIDLELSGDGESITIVTRKE